MKHKQLTKIILLYSGGGQSKEHSLMWLNFLNSHPKFAVNIIAIVKLKNIRNKDL